MDAIRVLFNDGMLNDLMFTLPFNKIYLSKGIPNISQGL